MSHDCAPPVGGIYLMGGGLGRLIVPECSRLDTALDDAPRGLARARSGADEISEDGCTACAALCEIFGAALGAALGVALGACSRRGEALCRGLRRGEALCLAARRGDVTLCSLPRALGTACMRRGSKIGGWPTVGRLRDGASPGR